MKIQKRSGKEEEFSEKKTHDSIIRAGGKEETAKNVLKEIKPRQGMATSEVREKVIKGLSEKEPEVAKSFKTYKK